MAKAEFGPMVREARLKKGYSLRRLADRVALDYSRLARIEHGRRPPPDLMTIRLLAEALGLDLADLVVAAGTSQEVVRHLLWTERLHRPESAADVDPGWIVPPELARKNHFRVRILARDGALCTARFGDASLRFFFFGDASTLCVRIPPEAILVWSADADHTPPTVDNRWTLSIARVRRLGQVANLVLDGPGFTLNSVHEAGGIDRLELRTGSQVLAGVPSTAVRTVRVSEKEGS
jgi:transcriptional regulator with XRE-family HTH domain